MINDEIKTGFRWYDDPDKQIKNRNYCQAACDFKRLTPLNTVPNFQIRTTDTSLVGFPSWKIYCAEDDQEYLDITSKTGNLSAHSDEGFVYVIYNGASLSITLPCGSFYMVLETTNETYYSEVFYTSADVTDTSFSQMDFPLFTAWRWYNDQDKQNRYKGYCENLCDFYRICGDDALLPFMFRKSSVSNTINSWVLRDLDGTCEHNLVPAVIHINVKDGYDYIFYNGDAIADLPCGKWESILTINGVPYYSELIWIVDTINSNTDTDFLLQETGDMLLLETGFGILLE